MRTRRVALRGTHIRSGRTVSPSERIAGAGSLKLIAWNGGGDYKVNRIETEAGPQGAGTYTVSYKARWVVGARGSSRSATTTSPSPRTRPRGIQRGPLP
jgi:hypothetical protein